MNIVVISGRLTKDPEVRYSSGNDPKAVARFNVAVNRMKEGTDFISCVALGKTAEFIEKYFIKGKGIELTGRIQTGSYEKDGHKIYTTDVVADRVEFPKAPKDGSSSSSQSNVPSGFAEIDDDEDIPFYEVSNGRKI